MIKLTKINNIIVEPIKLPQPPKNVKGSELFNQLNANILVCAPKNSGKTVVIKKIIDECTNKQTNVLIFCATVHNDHSWLEIQKDLDKRGITFMTFTSIYDDKANVLEAFIQSLQVKPNENSKPLILTNNIVAEKSSSKKEVAPDYLIIFDDLSNELKDPSITKLMKIQRHFSTKIIISTQSWKDTSSHIRKGNLDYVLLFKNIPTETLKIIYDELSLAIPFKLFTEIYSYSTKEKFHFLYTSLGGQQGDGFGDWFKKAYDFVKENKLISRGAKALGDAGVPYASKIGDVADKLGYGKKPRRKRTQAGGTQYGINGGAKRKRGARKKFASYFKCEMPGYIPTPLDFYEYFTHWIQFKYNISGGSFVYSMNQIHIVRIGKLVTLCVDSPPTFTMRATAQASEVYTDVIMPERFRPPNLQMVTVCTYQKQTPTLFIHPCRICCMLDGQLIIQNSDGSGIPCDANQSFSIDPFSMSYVLY
ncbi:hypothetical protein DFA_06760 [Cavenderia fasciculata]|uniref:Uncharacterized protein n=1 Tax=Cavenderia fasciculata TaxID=261658 RepID=F4Q273_CACFS|nr:uncharacterized protein DFA_06760 [Cavenderia fasciculata]EGG18093.1 hypothetical protein DFA_06760 [Cavenderia fasciculata]|eukprot:XP_004366134.1 hypothetical protein DFA_06760 [Cavenderia fasciculata]